VITQQVQPNAGVLPFVQQYNFGQIQGAVTAWNPNFVAQAPNAINQIVRQIYARKTWYGLFTKGQIICPASVSGGTATVTFNSNTVQGNNTTWDQTLIGRQFRAGLNTPIYTITGVDPFAQVLTLELPWGGPFPPGQTTQTTGYYIVQMYYSFGPNIKYIKTCVNMQMGFKLWTNLTQDYLDNRDPWRITVNFPWGLAPMPADPNGNYLIELWPAPFTQQALPFMAYTQPANLVNDTDSLPPYIRCDVVIKEAMCWALRYKPKDNPGYDPQTALSLASTFHQEYEGLLVEMMNEDENLYRTSATIQGEDLPFYTPGGSLWDAQHAVMSGGAINDW
jgi:hypothetical protein